MSSSTATISSSSSTITNSADRKRPISSSIRPSPSPPSAKRHGVYSTNARHTQNNNIHRAERNERQSRSKQQYRHLDHKTPSPSNPNDAINSKFTSVTIHELNDTLNSTVELHDSNQVISTSKPHLNPMNSNNQIMERQPDVIYIKKAKSIPLIVGRTSACNSDDEFESTTEISNKISNKSAHMAIPSSLMTIVTTPDMSKKSARPDNVIIQQLDASSNSSSKLVKLVVPQTTSASSPSIKMLSSADGLQSALRIPTKIQLTKTLSIAALTKEKHAPLISTASTNLLDIPTGVTEKQEQTRVDYHSSTTLPPTPPPPVTDNNATIRNVLSRAQSSRKSEQVKHNEIRTFITTALEHIDSSTTNHTSIQSSTSKCPSAHIDHASSTADWSVPSTSELSPTSLTSSSPDLTQTNPLIDDSHTDNDVLMNPKRTSKHTSRSLSLSCPLISTVTTPCVQSNEATILPCKSKSLSGLSKAPITTCKSTNNISRTLTTSSTMKSSPSQRLQKRQCDHGNLANGKISKSKSKHKKSENDDDQIIIQELLNNITEAISMNSDSSIELRFPTSITHENQAKSVASLSSYRSRKKNHNEQAKADHRINSTDNKIDPLPQSSDLTEQNDSRSMVITPSQLDDLAYLLHANVHRRQLEQTENPAAAEQRMRDMWAKMSMYKKNSYYKRVIQIYKRPNRDVVIASASSTTASHTLTSNNSPDNETNSLSVELTRPTAPLPLSFHSVISPATDVQSAISPDDTNSKTSVFKDIVEELIRGVNGLDKLACPRTEFIDSFNNFVHSRIEQQNNTVEDLEKMLEKKCSTQLNRATIFWTQKINYFAGKHSIKSSNESMNELTLIVKYFYLFILSLNCRKQEAAFESALKELLNGNISQIDQFYSSTTLTHVIEDLIIPSSLANDYFASQPIIIGDVEYLLPLIRHIELENELLNRNDINLNNNPFSNLNDLEDYLNCCEYITTTIPFPPLQPSHSSMFYSSCAQQPSQYYYNQPPSQSSDISSYYYNPTMAYSNYSYGQQPTAYYHSSAAYNNNNNGNEQYKYYYNSPPPQPQSSYMYPSQTNSTNDIPVSNNSTIHRTYRQMNSNMQRTYNNAQQPTPSPIFDATTVVSPQSQSMNTTNNNNNNNNNNYSS